MTLVDTATGEIVHRAALVVPRPTEVADVYDLCTRTEAALPMVDDVAEACDAKAKFAAIDTYLAQTSKDGRSRLAETMRRLEARIGELIGAADQTQAGPGRGKPSIATEGFSSLSKDERSEFRLMAAHPEVVEAVISESDDNTPASRRKVVAAIRTHLKTKKMEDVVQRIANGGRVEQVRACASLGLDATQTATELDLDLSYVCKLARDAGIVLGTISHLGVAERIATARRMAAEGHTSEQIGAAIGVKAMSNFRKKYGIEVPADDIVGKKSKLDSNRIVRATVEQIVGIDAYLDAIDYSALDRSQLDHWVSSLSDAIRSLTTLRNNLKKEQTQ